MMVIFIKLHYYRLLITCLNQLAVKQKTKKKKKNWGSTVCVLMAECKVT